jgi:hypothetical protein
MATKSKEELLAEAKELGLNLPEDSKVADIKTAIASKKAESETPTDEEPAKEGDVDYTGGREPRVADEPESTFDERTTGANQPWLNEDGTQNTGE